MEKRDLVCRTIVQNDRYMSVHNGQRYYFCSSFCKREFEKKPDTYVVREHIMQRYGLE